jgi:hypothetical protein
MSQISRIRSFIAAMKAISTHNLFEIEVIRIFYAV